MATSPFLSSLVSQFSSSVVSNSLWPHGLQHARPSCPSPTTRAYSNSCPLPRWCHPTVSSSVVPVSFRLQSCPASGSLLLHQLFTSGGQSIKSFSFSISPSNEHPGLIFFRMDWLDLLEVQGTLQSLLQHHSSNASILLHSAFFIVQLSYPHMTTGKTIAWTIRCKSKKRKSPGNKLLHSSFVHSPSPLTVNSFCGQQHEVLHSSEPFSGSYLSENLLTVGETCQES